MGSSSSEMRITLLFLAAFAAANDKWEENDSFAPRIKQKITSHTPSPLFIDRSGSNEPSKIGFSETKFSNLLQTVSQANGESFTVENFLEHDGKPFVLSSYEVFAEGAKLVQQNADGTESAIPRPKMIHLHGSISGDPSSFVVMHLSARGSLGLIQTAEKKLSIESDPAGHSILVDAAKIPADGTRAKEIFAAEEEGEVPDQLPAPKQPTVLLKTPLDDSRGAPYDLTQTSVGNKYEIGIAIDCDQLCVTRLNQYAPGSGQGTDATSYLTALIAGTATVYKRDLGRDLKITYLKLWNGASPFDSGTNSLTQYREYYLNPPTQTFDVAHLMTGIQEGGVAYVGTVCRAGYNVGVSSLRGQWRGSTSGSSAYMWDLEVTAHELGHNFGSGHSHDYDPPIDECVSCREGFTAEQCKSGGGAVGPVSRSDARCVKGTVMSYCHLCGGMENINMNFHPRAIEKLKSTLNANCGEAGPAPTPAPTPVPATPAPTPAPATSAPPTTAPPSESNDDSGGDTDNVGGNGVTDNGDVVSQISRTITQTVRIQISSFDAAAQQSFKSAVAQLLTDASGANTTAAGGFQVLPEDITILNTHSEEEHAAAVLLQTGQLTESATDVQYEVKAPASATDQQLAQVEATLDSSAETDSMCNTDSLCATKLTSAITAQCDGQCVCSSSSVVAKASTAAVVQQNAASRESAVNFVPMIHALIVVVVLGVTCW